MIETWLVAEHINRLQQPERHPTAREIPVSKYSARNRWLRFGLAAIALNVLVCSPAMSQTQAVEASGYSDSATKLNDGPPNGNTKNRTGTDHDTKEEKARQKNKKKNEKRDNDNEEETENSEQRMNSSALDSCISDLTAEIGTRGYAPGAFLAGFSTSEQQAEQLVANAGLTVLSDALFPPLRVLKVGTQPGVEKQKACEFKLGNDSFVKYVQLDGIVVAVPVTTPLPQRR